VTFWAALGGGIVFGFLLEFVRDMSRLRAARRRRGTVK
jgi:hypothetical protein